MTYQVGFACYATLQGAGSAACASFSPVTSFINGGSHISTISCQFAGADGSLQLKVSTVPTAGGVPVLTSVNTPIQHQPCQYQDFIDAGLTVFVAVLAVYVSYWGLRQIYLLLHWSRGDEK